MIFAQRSEIGLCFVYTFLHNPILKIIENLLRIASDRCCSCQIALSFRYRISKHCLHVSEFGPLTFEFSNSQSALKRLQRDLNLTNTFLKVIHLAFARRRKLRRVNTLSGQTIDLGYDRPQCGAFAAYCFDTLTQYDRCDLICPLAGYLQNANEKIASVVFGSLRALKAARWAQFIVTDILSAK